MQTPVTTTSVMRGCLRAAVLLIFGLGSMLGSRVAGADTVPTLFNSFAGNINFIGTQKTLRTQSDGGDSCAINAGTTTAALAGLPAGATIRAAYLYWAGSGNTPDYSVTFEGSGIAATAARSYTATFVLGSTYNYFSGAYDVTGIVATKGNGTYSFAGLTVDDGDPWCASSAVMGGWALLVIYSHSSEDFRVINVYEGFQAFRGSSITLTPSNFQIPVSPINGKDAHLTWEGDVGNSDPLDGFNERLTFEGNTLTDASNPANNQFNSVSTINSPVDTVSYGVDFDVYDVSSYLVAGQTSATTVYSSGGDLVLLSAQIISTTNAPVADLAIAKTRNGDLIPGQNASYTLNVINNGPLNETGPVTIVDTLPAGLSYVSASAGWSCSAAAQVVTCIRAGSLASGASTPALTLTVAVSPSASGTVTNTATVSGQDFDNISWNNTATDSYTIPIQAYAYYAMDETSWGAVTDSSGNGRNGTVLGSAAPTGYPPASPPGSAIPGNPGTCGAGSVPATAGTQGVNTAIDLNSMGNAGTISFWYSSNTVWNDTNIRMLLDASADLGNENADKNFFLSKQANGSLRFSIEDTGDTASAAVTGALSYAANSWHHIAVVWNLPADRLYIYVDGVLSATSTTNVNGTLGAVSSLYLGDSRITTGLNGPPTGWTTNSANGYLDEVRLYASALTAAQIAADMNATHSCVALDHYAISYPGGATAVTCDPHQVTITGHNPGHVATAPAAGTVVTLNTSTGTGVWTTKDAGSGTWWSSGLNNGAATYTWPGVETSFTVRLRHNSATTLGVNLLDSNAKTEGAGEDPSLTFSDAAFRVTDAAGAAATFGTHIAGKNSDTGFGAQTRFLQAIRTDTATGSCVALIQNQTVTVEMAGARVNPTGGASQASVRNSAATMVPVATSAGAPPGSYTGVSLAFDAQSKAPLVFNYPDAGSIEIYARYQLPSPPSGIYLNGSSGAFVVRPFGFAFRGATAATAIQHSTTETDALLAAAGDNFTMTVAAYQWAAGEDTNNDGVPDAGVNIADNGLTPNFAASTTVAPSANLPGVALGAMSRGGACASAATIAAGSFSGGAATITDWCYSEAGNVFLAATSNDYISAGVNITGNSGLDGTGAGYVGRFRPKQFALDTVTPPALANRAALLPCVSSFTYMGEGMRLTFRLFAQNTQGATTQNYNGVYAKLNPNPVGGPNAAFVFGARSGATNLTSRVSASYPGAISAWANGELNIPSSDPVYVSVGRATPQDGPYTGVQFGIAPTDSDSVAMNTLDLDVDNNTVNDRKNLGVSAEVRFGRLRLHNAYGSELLPLPIPMTVQYWNGTAFITNTLDSCTPLLQANIGFDNYTPNLSVGETTPAVGAAFNAGVGSLILSAPGPGNNGSVDLAINLGTTGSAAACTLTPAASAANLGYLRGQWCGGAYDKDPAARATFGVYKNPNEFIYLREMY